MTLTAARKTLARPLVFGDPDQIKAVNFIGRAQECLEALESCPHLGACGHCNGKGEIECSECDGTGECSKCGVECQECNGHRKTECEDCNGRGKGRECHCLDAFTPDEKDAALVLDKSPRILQRVA